MVNKVINDFHSNLEGYFANEAARSGFPSVAYFAEKAFLSTNYFGDLVKHLTGKSATDYIQNYAITLAQQKLLNSTLTIGEISRSLGFEYPNYFAFFFRRKTGLSPTDYRKQSE
ncbi:AraC family transcriptional regulator [Mucilaginibacter rubeus]|uniref:AraC family transcriptional regulator n=1 Tax=Mucilaginibacter rubeus TaxID=2027860 RepID=A0AAE6MHM9_9SPHI|nr:MULTISPECIES: helix-turn-helix domain-containing protein [Mucilaginibacter]QEM03771.1 AraC family transcriptional regulator [Mucilaginibacter rubeus]QEM16383.1 AraC family transcriptional regulator [Mucilaginibacter gossypii]QTE40850.1 AraC family transcriptional regulator [Mucilaginibacter rubeus]QTE47453.1 AraC family transcriptional regulator [Mucilaginibacter rubeus]QTE58846.1 AraC family transcriptional regulator [Mucilaginibacter rubeus]